MSTATLAAIRRRDPIARLGLAILIGILSLVSAGGWVWWRCTDAKRVHLTLFFDNSVHGISVGTPVKILGVRVGQVESLGVRLPSHLEPKYYAEVKLVLDGDVLASKGLPRNMDRAPVLRDEIARGLFGRLRLLSPMSGTMYVELDYDVGDPSILIADPDETVAEVPTRRDPLADGILDATHKMAEIGTMNLVAMEQELRDRLDRIHAAVDPAFFESMNTMAIDRLERTRAGLESASLKASLADVNRRSADLRGALERLNSGAEADFSRLSEAVTHLRVALEKAGDQAKKIGGALDPRTPALLVAYARIAVIRDEAAGVRALCERVLNARGVLESLFLATGDEDDEPAR